LAPEIGNEKLKGILGNFWKDIFQEIIGRKYLEKIYWCDFSGFLGWYILVGGGNWLNVITSLILIRSYLNNVIFTFSS
jgi:hypothetical protein